MSAWRRLKPGHTKYRLIGGAGNGKLVQIEDEFTGPFCWNSNGRREYYTYRLNLDYDGNFVELWGHESLTNDTIMDIYFGGKPYTHNKEAYTPSTKEPHEFLQAE